MRYSVSATCLAQATFEENVKALLDYPIDDLHCDYFPEIAPAPSLSLDQLTWCAENWPRSLTIHLWGIEGLQALPQPARRGRLRIQLHDGSHKQILLVRNALHAGWTTGISIGTHLLAPVMRRISFPIDGVQLLTTSTPGYPGGTLVPSALSSLDDLQHLRRTSCARWSIEVDGGLTKDALLAMSGRCDLGVIGTNYLRTHPATGHCLPDRLLEATCLSISTN